MADCFPQTVCKQLVDHNLRYPVGHRAARKGVRETGSFPAFLALQNWSDDGQNTLPGYRERIVEVRHTGDEGGINIDMSTEQIRFWHTPAPAESGTGVQA